MFDCWGGVSLKPQGMLLPTLMQASQTQSTRRFSTTRLGRYEESRSTPATEPSTSKDGELSRRTVTNTEAAPPGGHESRPTAEDDHVGPGFGRETAGTLYPKWAHQQRHEHYQGQDSLGTLRSSGATTESVVRKARQVFGESLPGNVLSKEEFKLYRRLYGEPVQWIPGDATNTDGIAGDSAPAEDSPRHWLDHPGQPLQYDLDGGKGRSISLGDQRADQAKKTTLGSSAVEKESAASREQLLDAILDYPVNDHLQQVAEEIDGEVYHSNEADDSDWDQDSLSSDRRAHPLTSLGRFATYPRTVHLPQEAVIKPVERLLSDYSNKHLKEVCERTFGGGGLPNSPLTPRSGRTMPQVPVPLQASQHSMGEMDANAFMTVVMPSTYAATNSVLVEIRKRLGTSWLNRLLVQEGGPRILDAGAGGAGIMAWRDVVRAEWEALHSSDRNAPPPPLGKAMVLTGSDSLRHRSATLLENTTFIPRLPDYVHVRDTPTLEDDRPVAQRKEFDVIIAAHTLWPFKEEWERKQHIQNLWSLLSPEGGVLILIEKGVPRGFEAIAGAREQLLERYIASPNSQTYDNSLESPLGGEGTPTQKAKGMIIAPCTNHSRCPMYPVGGMSRGRKDYCSFQQRYIRPQYLQRILGAKDRSHDDVDFSYVSVLKGKDLREHSASSFSGLEDPSSAPQSSATAQLTPDQVTQQAFEGFEHVEASEESVSGNMTTPTGITESADSFPSLRDMPRLVYPPLKRRGHVTLDVCTPAGKIERWTVPKSYSKQAYRDARKSNWGDLWALGAKTRVARNLKLGGPGTKEGVKAHNQKNRMMDKAAELAERMEEERLVDMEEVEELEKEIQSATDNVAVPEIQAKRHFPQPSTKPAMVEGDQEDVDVARALAEWEEEFKQDKRVGRKNVRSVREGTKNKRQTSRVAPVWHGNKDLGAERLPTRA